MGGGVQCPPLPTSTGSPNQTRIPVPGRAEQPHVPLTPGLCPRFTTYLAGTFGTGRGGLASARVRDGRQLGWGEGPVTRSPGSGGGGSSRGPGRGVSHGAEAGGEGRAVAHVPPGVGGHGVPGGDSLPDGSMPHPPRLKGPGLPPTPGRDARLWGRGWEQRACGRLPQLHGLARHRHCRAGGTEKDWGSPAGPGAVGTFRHLWATPPGAPGPLSPSPVPWPGPLQSRFPGRAGTSGSRHLFLCQE